MKDVLVKVFSNGQIFLPNNILGYEGEHIARNIIVKMDNFIDGVAILEIDPKKEETDKHFLTMEKQEDTYVLPIYESLLTEKELNMQLVITINEEVVFKSEVFTFEIGNSINAKDREFLEEYASYVTKIENSLSRVDKVIEDLNQKIEEGYFKGDQGPEGPKGADGTMTFEDLTPEQKESLKGDKGSPFLYEDFTEEQLENLRGPAGKDGQDGTNGIDGKDGTNGLDGESGATFTPSIDEEGNLSWTNDKGLENPATVNIKGPQGPIGQAGINGQDGIVDYTQVNAYIDEKIGDINTILATLTTPPESEASNANE